MRKNIGRDILKTTTENRGRRGWKIYKKEDQEGVAGAARSTVKFLTVSAYLLPWTAERRSVKKQEEGERG